jgi:hypothetical protein
VAKSNAPAPRRAGNTMTKMVAEISSLMRKLEQLEDEDEAAFAACVVLLDDLLSKSRSKARAYANQ